MSEQKGHWADEIAAEAIAAHPENLVCTGITPSGEIHIGNMREVLSGDAVYRAILDSGAQARFLYIGDTYDSLRRVYPFLDAAVYGPLVGKPLSDVPCSCGKHESYAHHFLEPFLAALKELGLTVEVKLAHELYREGFYKEAIFQALEARERIAAILKDETGKEVTPDWSPANPKCSACGKITEAKVTGFDRAAGTVGYACACGHAGEADAGTGGVKLTWRVDWPARWAILGVTVEPFGKDHASKGGSYDTGRRIAKEVYGYDAPVPVVYEWISLKGQGDMSSSKGNVVSIADMLRVVPPDVLRYMIFRTRPKKSLVFDPALPMLNLIDELDDAENKSRDERAIALSMVSGMGSVGIPFKHLVNIVQIAGGDDEEALRIIERGGYAVPDRAVLLRRLAYARRWLAEYAPEDMRFSKAACLPERARVADPAVKAAFLEIAAGFTEGMDGEAVHTLVYAAKERHGLEPTVLFRALYLALIDKERGPRAGWFLSILGRDFVAARLREAVG
jgi:lysyl-tRNA synthetase class 1